jgi:hypothetical protein
MSQTPLTSCTLTAMPYCARHWQLPAAPAAAQPGRWSWPSSARAGPASPDLLLCGHHYRACRNALQAASAAVRHCWPDPETGPGRAMRFSLRGGLSY